MKLAHIEAFNPMQAKLEAGKGFNPHAALNKNQQDTLRVKIIKTFMNHG